MLRLLANFLDFWIPEKLKGDAMLHLRGRLMVQSFLMVMPLMVFFAIEYAILGHPWAVSYSVYGLSMAVWGVFDFKRRGKFSFSGNLFSFTAMVVIAGQSLTVHGLQAMIAPWVIMVPISGFLLVSIRAGVYWSIASVALVIGMFALDYFGYQFNTYLPDYALLIVNTNSVLGLVGYILMILLNNEVGKGRLLNDLRRAKAQVDLKNIEISAINRDLEHTVVERTKGLQAANEELDTFLYESSHALRRPLMRILGLMNLLEIELSQEERDRFMGMIGYTAHHMDRMLQDLLLVSEIFHREMAPQPTSLQEEVQKLVATLDPHVQFRIDIAPEILLTTDPELLRIVLRKILDNAVSYRREDTLHMVHITAAQHDGSWQLRIADNGQGIDPAARPHLFKMFGRGTEQSRGSGLGLFIVRKAMERLHGQVEIESEKGNGTEVILDFGSASEALPQQGHDMAVA